MDGFKKVEAPEIVKLKAIGDQIKGQFIRIEPSTKYADGFALAYSDNEKPKVTFINQVAKQLFDTNSVKKGEEFCLIYTDDKEGGNGKYRVYELYLKE